MPTLKDVAREAGLSLTTVATILRGQTALYHPETVARVEGAAKKTGYTPNHFSRNLVKGRTGVLLFAISRSRGATFNRESLLALPEAAKRLGYKLLVEPVDEVAGAAAKAAFLSSRYYDGVIANFTSWSTAEMDEVEERLSRASTPVLWFNQDRARNAVAPDEASDAARMASQFHRLNYRRICYIGHPPEHGHFSSRERHTAFRDRATALGLEVATCLAPSDPDWDLGEKAWAAQLSALRGGWHAFDAVLLSHAFLAPRLFELANPRPLPVYSFDLPSREWGAPPMGGQRIPWTALAEKAVERLARRIEEGGTDVASVRMEGEWVEAVGGNGPGFSGPSPQRSSS